MRRGLTAAGLVAAILTAGARVGVAAYQYDPSDFATTVVEYVQGTGVGTDFISGDPFDDAYTALGRPTVDTTGEGFFIPIGDPVPVVPVYSPFRAYEIVTIGLGGRLIVEFDHQVADDPRNPYGLDFIVFGNAYSTLGGQQWFNGDPNSTSVTACGYLIEPGTVSVSQDGQTWYTFTAGPFADDFSPTLGRVYDPLNPDPSLGPWNQWWGQPTDPTVPLDPQLNWSDFCNQTVAQISQIYERSAGGTGFDLADLEVPGLDWIQYLRIDAPSSGGTPEIDAAADVFALLGDSDRDGDLDLADLAAFQACFTGADNGPRGPECLWADFDGNPATGDMDVDLADYEQFYQYLVGPVLGNEQGHATKLQ